MLYLFEGLFLTAIYRMVCVDSRYCVIAEKPHGKTRVISLTDYTGKPLKYFLEKPCTPKRDFPVFYFFLTSVVFL